MAPNQNGKSNNNNSQNSSPKEITGERRSGRKSMSTHPSTSPWSHQMTSSNVGKKIS